MGLRLTALSALLCLSFSCAAIASGKHEAAERYIKQKEAEWAEQSVSNDDGLLRRLLADDYIGVSSSSQVETKPQQIEEALAAKDTDRHSKADRAARRIPMALSLTRVEVQ